MTSEHETLFDRVVAHLDLAGVPFPLIGAGALAAHERDVDIVIGKTAW